MPARQRPFDDERVRRVFEFINPTLRKYACGSRRRYNGYQLSFGRLCKKFWQVERKSCSGKNKVDALFNVKHVERGVFKVNAIR